MELDEPVHGLGAAVAGPAGVEVAEVLGAPGLQGLPEPGDLGDGAGVEGVDDCGGDGQAGGVGVLVVGGADLLGAGPGDLDLDMAFIGGERGLEPGLLSVGQVLDPGAQDVPDPVQGVVLASAVAVDILLDPAPGVIDRGGGELDDMERVMPTSA